MTQDIAIVGMSCRLPGASDLDGLWRLLSEGHSAIAEVPPERWDLGHVYDTDPLAAGKANTRWGGFIAGADLFDPDFFAMSHEEAVVVDPQQRMMLELAWAALEHAGVDPHGLKRGRAGVYVGISHNDYERITCRDPTRITRFHGTGAYQSMAANRLSYFLDTMGPSMTIDTACSSGLSALHIACQHLRSGETPLAVVGAVTLHLTPEETIGLAKGRLLSPDGQCKSFDEGANGYVRAEGGVSLVLRRLDDALADGSRVLAVIKGSAVNHNGRSNGLSAPNGLALQAVMQQALTASGIKPEQVDFVEAHGTGTPLGDQLELKALREVYGKGDAGTPCWIGCLKTNLGHLETTSGLAALAKVVLAIGHGTIPPNLNFSKSPANIDLSTSRLAFPTRQEPWPARKVARRAAVTAYGFGGANAHVIVESPPARSETPTAVAGAHLLCISAVTSEAHRDLLVRYADHLRRSTDAFADICFTAATGRAQFNHRSAFVASSAHEAIAQIQAELASWSATVGTPKRIKVVMHFLGIAARYGDAAPSSWQRHAVYRSAWGECVDEVRSAALDASVNDERVLAFAHAYALAQQWSSWGVKPVAVAGRGTGKLVAAAVAGAITPLNAATILLGRSSGARVSAPRLPLIDEQTGEVIAIESFLRGLNEQSDSPDDAGAKLARNGLVLRLGDDAGDDMLPALRQLFLAGIKLSWRQILSESAGQLVDLPQYPFQRVRCWFDTITPNAIASRVSS